MKRSAIVGGSVWGPWPVLFRLTKVTRDSIGYLSELCTRCAVRSPVRFVVTSEVGEGEWGLSRIADLTALSECDGPHPPVLRISSRSLSSGQGAGIPLPRTFIPSWTPMEFDILFCPARQLMVRDRCRYLDGTGRAVRNSNGQLRYCVSTNRPCRAPSPGP